MDDGRDLLMETFTAHEPATPDTLDVLANVDAIAKTHRRNRWALRVTGVSLMSAGIVAGSLGVSGLLSSSPGHSAQLTPADSGSSSPATPASYTQAQEMTAYFDAGYDYTNAQQLEKLWHMSPAFSNKVKAKAGLKLLEGETLPVKPDGQPASPENKAVEAFFAAGYDYTDAQTLAAMWHTSTYGAKVEGGKDLEAGQTLPVKPSGNTGAVTPATIASPATTAALKRAALMKLALIRQEKNGKHVVVAVPRTASSRTGSADDTESPALAAYFDAGYDYTNAQQLAKLWNETDINQVKAQAGQKLLNGDTLPVKPDNQPAPPENKAVNAFFAAGYDYNDAVKLGKMWKVSTYRAKIDGGKKIEAGQALPIQPGS